MTKYITAAVLFVILLTFSAAGLAVSVINPGFELSGDGLEGWNSEAAIREKYIAGVIDESYDSSGMCATLKNLEANHSYLVQRITGGKSGDCYLITVMAKVPDAISAPGAGITAQKAGAEANSFSGVSSRRLTRCGDWEELSLYVVLTGGATQFDLYLELGSVTEYSEGEVYFDCVKIERLEELPEGAEAAVINGGGGLSADAYIIIGVILCVLLAAFIAFRRGAVRKRAVVKEAEPEENDSDEI